MTFYAGIDVGIKNLAYCIVNVDQWKLYKAKKSNDPGIVAWENINLIGEPPQCQGLIKSGTKKGCQCGAEAKWVLVSNGLDTITKEYYCGRHKVDYCDIYKHPLIKNLNLRTIKRDAFVKLNEIEWFDRVKKIAIETQPRKNQQMKMFAASIDAYFIIRRHINNTDIKCTIKNSPAKNKLKMYRGPKISTAHIKDPYDKRKYLAKKQTEYFLSRAPEILDQYYWDNKKRDDLADAFLHAIIDIK